MIPVGVKLTPDTLDELRERANAGDRTVSAEIRRAIRAHLATTKNAPAAANGEGVKDAGAAAHDSGF